jgi:hypothetical protein
LVEHYRCSGEEPSKIADVLRRINTLDAAVHQQYVS